jgi:allantoate deiminase
MRGVHALLGGWMEAVGLETRIDAAGNLRGLLYPKTARAGRRVILGSHLDTVPNAGAFDGILGVVLALEAVAHLDLAHAPATEIIGFSEEEGVRFRKPFLGSFAVLGRLDAPTLALTDAAGVTVAEAIRNYGLDPAQLPSATLAPDAAAYLEVHIEQGPVLDSLGGRETLGGPEVRVGPEWFASPGPFASPGSLPGADSLPGPNSPASSLNSPRPLGIVDAIAGQTRLRLTFTGQANHAGTTPMHLRHDALAAAAAWMTAVESYTGQRPGLVATIGSLSVEPGASNVIPGLVHATLDLRHADDSTRTRAIAHLLSAASAAANTRGVLFTHELILDQPAVPMDARLQTLLREAVIRAGHTPYPLTSGAGHDAMILAPHLPSAMLFVPSPGGISHHPDESVRAPDVEAAIQTLLEFLRHFSEDETPNHA